MPAIRSAPRLIGRGRESGRQVGAVLLVPTQVLVETCAAGQPAVSRAVPVEEYADADPGRLTARAAQIAGHTNAAHSDLLRRLAAARAGIPVAQVAAAWLTGLNQGGAEPGWVDAGGAHAMTARFPRRARTATEVAMLLREQLAGR